MAGLLRETAYTALRQLAERRQADYFTAAEVARAIRPPVSQVAVRRALNELVNQYRVYRVEPVPGSGQRADLYSPVDR